MQRVKQVIVERKRQQGFDQIEPIRRPLLGEAQPFACCRGGALVQQHARSRLECADQPVSDVRQPRIQAQRGRVGRGRLIESQQVAQRIAEIGVRVDQSGGSQRTADQRDRLLRFAVRASRHAEQVQGIRILGIACQNGSVTLLRRIEVSRAVSAQGGLKKGRCIRCSRVHRPLVAPTACHPVNDGVRPVGGPLRRVHSPSADNAAVSDALAASVAHHLQHIMQAGGTHDEVSRGLLRLAANYRLEVLRPRLIAEFGLCVADGLFAGMRLLAHASEGCFVPKLLGFTKRRCSPIYAGLSKPATTWC